MKFVNKVIKSEPAQKLFGYAIACLMWVFHLTVRWQRNVDSATQALLDADKPVILCLWHGRIFFVSGGWSRPPEKLGLLASAHRDGRLIARAAEAFGYEAALGSSRRGGATALRGVSRLLERGVSVMITPDGPKGPRMRVKPGAIKAAQMTGAPLVALTGSARPRKVFGTWDRFCLPLPFARAVIHLGPPIKVPRDADAETLEGCRRAVEESLNSLTNAAERALGQEEIQAAAEEGGGRHARA